MYAIQNVKTGQWVYGTDFRYPIPHQRTSKDQMMTWEDEDAVKLEFSRRKCGKDYKIAVLKTVEVKRYLE